MHRLTISAEKNDRYTRWRILLTCLYCRPIQLCMLMFKKDSMQKRNSWKTFGTATSSQDQKSEQLPGQSSHKSAILMALHDYTMIKPDTDTDTRRVLKWLTFSTCRNCICVLSYSIATITNYVLRHPRPCDDVHDCGSYRRMYTCRTTSLHDEWMLESVVQQQQQQQQLTESQNREATAANCRSDARDRWQRWSLRICT